MSLKGKRTHTHTHIEPYDFPPLSTHAHTHEFQVRRGNKHSHLPQEKTFPRKKKKTLPPTHKKKPFPASFWADTLFLPPSRRFLQTEKKFSNLPKNVNFLPPHSGRTPSCYPPPGASVTRPSFASPTARWDCHPPEVRVSSCYYYWHCLLGEHVGDSLQLLGAAIYRWSAFHGCWYVRKKQNVQYVFTKK